MALPEKKSPEKSVHDVISTAEVLRVSQKVINFIDLFDKVFASVKYDMQMNIDILTKRYNTNPELYSNIVNMITDVEKDNAPITDAILWLRRDFELFCCFFTKIVKLHRSGNLTEDLLSPLKCAYKETLEEHHSWMSQQLFGILSRMVPCRTRFFQLFSEYPEENWDSIVDRFEEFVQVIAPFLHYLSLLYARSRQVNG